MIFPRIPPNIGTPPLGVEQGGGEGGGGGPPPYGSPSIDYPNCYTWRYFAGNFKCSKPAPAAPPAGGRAPAPAPDYNKMIIKGKLKCRCFCSHTDPSDMTGRNILIDPGCEPPNPPVEPDWTRKFIIEEYKYKGVCKDSSKCTKNSPERTIAIEIPIFNEGGFIGGLWDTMEIPAGFAGTGGGPVAKALEDCGIKYKKRRIAGGSGAWGETTLGWGEVDEYSHSEPLTADQADCLNKKICGCDEDGGEDFNITLAKAVLHKMFGETIEGSENAADLAPCYEFRKCTGE